MRAFSTILMALTAAFLPLKAETPSNSTSVASAARAQIGKTVSYDPAYRSLDYPNGDMPISTSFHPEFFVEDKLMGLLGLARIGKEHAKFWSALRRRLEDPGRKRTAAGVARSPKHHCSGWAAHPWRARGLDHWAPRR